MSEKGRRRAPKAKWVFRWWDGPHYRQQSFDRKADRDAFRDEIRRRRQLGSVVVAPSLAIAELVEEWWELHVLAHCERNTQDNYLQTWTKHLRPRIGGHQLRQVTPRVVDQLASRMRREGVGAPTVLKALTVLQSILSFAERQEYIAYNPVAKVTRPMPAPARQVEPIPPEVVERLRDLLLTMKRPAGAPTSSGSEDAFIVAMLGYAGLRPQELLALDSRDAAGPQLVIHRKNVKGEVLYYTKTRKNRRFTTLAPLREDIAAFQLATGIRQGLLIRRRDGEPWRGTDWSNWRNRVFAPAAARVGLDGAVPYDLRGSFASLLVWEGHNLMEVAHQLGHSVAVCEDHYARVFASYDPGQRTDAASAVRRAREHVRMTPQLFYDAASG